MNNNSLSILQKVAENGEVTLETALRFASKDGGHVGQYPLALLLEDGYLGMTINHNPPEGAENMREYSLAITLHMFTLGRDPHGVVQYEDIRSSGSIKPSNEKVFLKAKGSLYLDEVVQKRRDRLWSLFVGITVGITVATVTLLLKGWLNVAT